jgi:hypothetical protein
MNESSTAYDERYLAGVILFNRGDFFEAHDVWEELWADSAGPERRFYQGLIQTAVALLHFGNGNLRGAAKLYRSSREYLDPLGPSFLGIDLATFEIGLERCLASVLDNQVGELDLEAVPEIVLKPEPAQWPDPLAYLTRDEE